MGTQLMKHVEQALIARGCVKINLQVVAGNRDVEAFYVNLGFVTEERISMGKRIPQNVPATGGGN